jgi:polysaccharide pyruvyl transferase WcaK-like protein
MKKIGLHGSYYGRNFGDTLILNIVNNWIKEFDPDIKVILPRIIDNQEAKEIIGERIFETSELKELDGLVFGPGGYFGEQSTASYFKQLLWSWRNYQRHLSWVKPLYKRKIPYMIVGVGVGPISNLFLRRAIIRLFKNAKVIAVRDKVSYEYLKKWGVDLSKLYLFSDVALSLNAKEFKSESNTIANRKKIAIHFPGKELLEVGKMVHFVQFLVKVSQDHDLYYLEDNVGQFSNNLHKSHLVNDLADLGVNPTVFGYKSPFQVIEDISKVDVLITSKLHVGIVGYAMNKPVISIPRHEKTFRFYEQVNRSEYCIKPSEITKEELLKIFNKCLQNPFVENIMSNEAMKNKQLLHDFLKDC